MIENGNEPEELFNDIYETYVKNVYAYFNVCFGNYVAEDLTQEMFLKVFKHIKNSVGFKPDNTRAWIFRVAVNIKNDYLRKKYITPVTESIDEYQLADEDMENNIINSMMINSALKKLGDVDRDIIIMTNMGLTSGEISKCTNLTASAIRSRIVNIRNKLKKILSEYEVDTHE